MFVLKWVRLKETGRPVELEGRVSILHVATVNVSHKSGGNLPKIY